MKRLAIAADDSSPRQCLRPLVVALGIAITFLASGCLWGFVRDADTGAGLPEVTVSYTDAQGQAHSTVTDVNGLYVFDLATGPVPAPGPARFEVNAAGYWPPMWVTPTRLIRYDDNPNAGMYNLSSFWEVQHFDLALAPDELTCSCATTLVGWFEPIRVVRGIDPVPTGPDPVNTAQCRFSRPIREISLELLDEGERAFYQRIILGRPSQVIGFPLSDEVVARVPADLEPGPYQRRIQATSTDGDTIQVFHEDTVWVD